MTRPARFGVTLPQIKRSWQETSAAALEFDSLGFDSLWVCDHLYGPQSPERVIAHRFESACRFRCTHPRPLNLRNRHSKVYFRHLIYLLI